MITFSGWLRFVSAFFSSFVLLFSFSAFAAPLSFTVNMSEAVNVTGTPRIAVDVGGVTRYASYASGTGTSALTFTYTPQVGDVDLDGVAVSSPVDLNGGAITDLNGNAILNLTFTPPNTANVKVDYPSLSMDFTGSDYILSGTHYGTLSSFLGAAGGSFTRGSVGTYFDSTGTLQTAGNNVARFDHDPTTHAAKGILIEEQRVNLDLYSEQANNAVYNKRNCTVSADITTSPNGASTADKIVEDVGAIFKELQIINTAVSTASYTASAFVKPAGRNHMYIFESQTQKSIVFDLSLGSTNGFYTGGGGIAPSYGITSVGNGWYRVWMTWNANAGTIPYVAFGLRNATGNFNSGYIGDGTSGIYIWGIQVESGAFPTSYIPTTNATVTRSADSFTIPTGGWFDGNVGTFYAYFDGGKESTQGTYGRVISSLGTYTLLSCDGGSTSIAGTWGGVTGPLMQASGQDYYTTAGTAAMSYNQTSMTRSLSTRGKVASTGSYANLYSFGTFGIGRNSGSTTNMLNGHIQKLKYYPARVADTQLQLLTQ